MSGSHGLNSCESFSNGIVCTTLAVASFACVWYVNTYTSYCVLLSKHHVKTRCDCMLAKSTKYIYIYMKCLTKTSPNWNSPTRILIFHPKFQLIIFCVYFWLVSFKYCHCHPPSSKLRPFTLSILFSFISLRFLHCLPSIDECFWAACNDRVLWVVY